ncbi:uncharacterized protein isoform X2 [Rhodnius prolixus]|uniref:uncharacterized protein isoform X2 n=1 Tax=Rhodnius prolixus TaxID=13249 RepID=UPI003D18C9FE
MEVEADPNLLVVNLEHCVSSETRHFGKSSCIYTTTMTPNNCSHDVLQLATPMQCIGDLNQPISRIQHQHLTQLQPLQYPQVQVSYENGGLQQPNGGLLAGGAPLYQAPPPSAALHHYHPPPPPPPPQTFHGSYLTPLSMAPPSSLQEYSPLIPPSPQQSLQEEMATQAPETSRSHAISTTTESSDRNNKVEITEPEPLPADDYQYYKEIERVLVTNEVPLNSSLLYNKRLRKRAQNYVMVDGVLHHNPKEPRRVVMTKDEQNSLLKSHHITPTTGVHIGIKKMFAKLRTECFWRGMYVGISTYVRKCTRCSDSAQISSSSNETSSIEREIPAHQNYGISVGLQTTSKIWNDVEIQVCGPYNKTNNRNSYIAVVVDPHSKFVLAAALPSSGLATRLTQFILSSLFSFGFSRAHLVTSVELYSAVHEEFFRRTRDLRDCHGLLRRRDAPCCGWVISLLTFLVDKKPYRWDRELDKFLYQFRSGEMKQFPNICSNDEESFGIVCPFYAMFQRSPCPLSAATAVEDKENSFPVLGKTGSNNSKHIHKTLQCRKNGDKSSEKLPSAEQTVLAVDSALKERAQEGCLYSYKEGMSKIEESNEEVLKQTAIDNVSTNGGVEPIGMTVSSIKAFLAETRVTRQRRGNYNKYPDELRDRMATYALKHGSQEAAKHFSALLGTQVNDSTIRNLLKSRARFGPDLRQEIAKFATENGVSEAAKHFSSILKMNVSHCLIRRFKSLYGSKRPHNKKTKKKLKKDIECLTLKVKDDIGRYANEHTAEETINHFKSLLGIDLLESSVKKLHQDYLKKQPLSEHLQEEQSFVKQESVPEYNVQNNVCYSQGAPSLVPQNAYYNSVQMCQPQYPAQCPGRPPETESGVVTQPFLLVSQEAHVNYDLGVQEKVDDKNNWENINKNGANDYHQYQPVENPIFVQVVQEKNNATIQTPIQAPPAPSIRDVEQPKKSKNKITGNKKRGKYSTFSPELRAEIGKYAVEHGCLKASNHFSSILGRDLPESTARGIKEKYLRKLKYSEVTSLGYSPRGRVPRLGKYDEMVQDCLKELIKTGERASSFLAIITARKILNKYEPNLLKENGGSIELNNSWAKSFLKRLGLRNNS